MRRSRLTRTVACLLAVAATLALAACGDRSEKGVDKPAREGLAIPMGGVDYNVFLTRELNLKIEEDTAYFDRPAPPGKSLYGVFLQACNKAQHDVRTASEFEVVDNQGNRFEPVEIPKENQFAYRPVLLTENECTPKAGSMAQLGPTGGKMVLFELPLQNTENRPLEFEIHRPLSAGVGDPEKLVFELDI